MSVSACVHTCVHVYVVCICSVFFPQAITGCYCPDLGAIDVDLACTETTGEGHHGQTGCCTVLKLESAHLHSKCGVI